MDNPTPFHTPLLLVRSLRSSYSSYGSTAPDEFFLDKIKACILKRLSDQNFGVEDLAQNIYLSVSQLNRRLNTLIDRPAGQLIREMRLNSAAKLLTKSIKTIGEIAEETGFSDQAHFCRSFKKYFRCTPSKYRKLNLSKTKTEFFSSSHAQIWQNNA